MKADKIESKLADYLSEILLQAGHFDKVEERIRELANQSPEQLKIDKTRLSLELQKLTLAIKNTFKIQAALDAESEAIRETAKELEELSRKKRHIEAELENLKTKEIAKDDVNDAIGDLKDRLASFRKGWIKASAVMKKNLLKDLVYFVLVGPKGLKIQFRLKHEELNKDVTPEELTAAKIFENNVVDLSEKRQKKSEEAKATSESKNSNNLAIAGSQVVGIGSESRT
ncbi:MAG: hypothetical protein B7Y39_05170 [Bdellovibrio sp. 28-41-41]|nr:MAG: hypothetical protein B7Y39_05170 [Bdellovibrio sp. 28-41-41]